MSFVHGKDTVVTVDGDDISAYSNSTQRERTADSHDVTTYGKSAHVFNGGLKNGTASISGLYDNTTSGPHDVIEPLLGTVVEVVFKPEGNGAGKPVHTVDALITKYTETNPVADMVTWAVDMQFSDDVTSTNQT